MTDVSARDIARGDGDGVVAALVIAKWLPLVAAPTFAVMSLLTVALDRGAPEALCSSGGGLSLSGMAPMYLLMAAFHLSPWLKLIFRRRNIVGRGDPFPSPQSSWLGLNVGEQR